MAIRLPYSPTLALSESWVALYKIYILRDPLTKEIFYVGQTSTELKTRLSGHISDSGFNEEKTARIRQIIEQGERPVIEEIETIAGTCYIDKLFVNDREIYWIKYYKSRGVKLLNIASSHDEAECKEFKSYLKSIQAKQTSYHFYYCGKTYAGHEVYDENKMNVDGFRLVGDTVPKSIIIPKIVEKIIEKPTYKIVYKERPTVPTKVLRNYTFPYLYWTEEFRLQIPAADPSEDFIEDEDECEQFETDWSDYEDEEEEDDQSDFEPDSDHEPETDEANDEEYEQEDEGDDEINLSYFDLL